MLYGVSKAITEYIGLGSPYDKVRKVYSINIVYFELGQGKDYVYHGKTEFRGAHEPHDIFKLSVRQNFSKRDKLATRPRPKASPRRANAYGWTRSPTKTSERTFDTWSLYDT